MPNEPTTPDNGAAVVQPMREASLAAPHGYAAWRVEGGWKGKPTGYIFIGLARDNRQAHASVEISMRASDEDVDRSKPFFVEGWLNLETMPEWAKRAVDEAA